MPSADQVPITSTHSKMLWPDVGCPDRRIDRRCIKCCSSSNRYVTPACPAVISLRRESRGFLVAFVPGHHGPSHPGELVDERDGSDLGGSPRQQSSEPGSMRCAVDLGIADHGERASREQAAQIAIALFADIAKLVFTPTRVLLRHEPNPGREMRVYKVAAGRQRSSVTTRSDLSIEQQVTATGCTWLDRELFARDTALSRVGFGAEVRQAMEARLIDATNAS
jgi:Protein of unknown function (DUF3363)